MYIIFEHSDRGAEFKTVLKTEYEVKEMLSSLGYKEAPYEIYEIDGLIEVSYTDFIPDFYKNF